ncbi:unnamed protein product, partial [Lymnaea stagnalis]
MAASKLSDEELLGDTSAAFQKSSELDLLGDDGELDEDALLSMDEAGTKTVSISFANDSVRPLSTRSRSRIGGPSHQHQVTQPIDIVDEQAFVFEETETTDLEDELNVAGEEDGHFHLADVGSVYQDETEGDFSAQMYHDQVGSGDAQAEISSVEEHHVEYNADSIHHLEADLTYVEMKGDQEGYEGGDGGGYVGDVNDVEYSASEAHATGLESSSVELGYEQPAESDEQVQLEYDTSEEAHQGDIAEQQVEHGDGEHYGSESESDDEDSRHNRGKFTSERTGVISLTSTTAREAIPDTLEINEEQAAQIEQFMTDKTLRGKNKTRGRPSAHSRLGNRPNMQGAGLLQGPRMGMFHRGMLGPRMRIGSPFHNSLQRGGFPGMNQRGPFPVRLMNQRGPFSGGQGQRVPFPVGPGNQRSSFPEGALALHFGTQSGPQRLPFQHGQFSSPPSQRGPFLGIQPRGPTTNNQRGLFQQQNIKVLQQNHLQLRGPQPNQAQFNHFRMPMGQGVRISMQGPSPQSPRPLMESSGQIRINRTMVSVTSGQPIPSLVKPVSTPPQSLLNIQQTGPRRVPPHQRLGPVQNQIRPQQPNSQSFQQPFYQARPQFSSNQGYQQALAGNEGQMMRKHKIYINPRFQNQQVRPQGPQTLQGGARTVKMGVPVQIQKAKALLDRAKQSQIKTSAQTQIKQVKQTENVSPGLKRKSVMVTNEVPAKIIKKPSNEEVIAKDEQPKKTLNEDSSKLDVLLEEQRRKRELIQKKKELARQRQAAIKRKELEERLKQEGKTLKDVLGSSEMEQEPPSVKPVSGSVAARLGPPPIQQQTGSLPVQRQKGPPVLQQQVPRNNQQQRNFQPPHPQSAPTKGASVGGQFVLQRPTGFPNGPQQQQNMFGSPPSPRIAFLNQPRMIVTNSPRLRTPSAVNDSRLKGAAPYLDSRFQLLASNSQQFRGPPPRANIQIRNPAPSSDPRLKNPLQIVDPRLRGPHIINHDPSYRGQRPVANALTPNQPVRFAPPQSVSQNIRYQAPHSAPPRGPPSQQYPSQFAPSNAPAAQLNQYPAPNPPTPTSYPTPAPQYTPQTASYHPSTYSPSIQQPYQQYPQTHQQPPAPQPIQQYAPTPSPQYQNFPVLQYNNQ